MNSSHDGTMPNNGVFHAEATVLLRAARENGGTLAGETMVVHSDRSMCARCKEMLPLIGVELGNPTVTFVCPLDVNHTMRGGTWTEPKVANRRTYFASRPIAGWPRPGDMERYFLAPAGRRWFNDGGNDTASLIAEGLFGTERLEPNKGRVDLHLYMWGHPDHGVLLLYKLWGGGYGGTYSSKGDLSRLRQWVRSLHDDPMQIGLYVPFEAGWKAVKEFIETGGAFPKSIEWVANADLPPGTFPDP